MLIYKMLFAALFCFLTLCPSFAVSPADLLQQNGMITVEFQPASSPVPDGVLVSDGSVYSAGRGYGWDTDITAQARDRAGKAHGIALLDRAVSLASFTIDLPDGDYLFDITSFDTDFPGVLAPVIDGELAINPKSYASGEMVSASVPVTSRNGKAVISFLGGRDGYSNSVVSSIRITPALKDPDRWQSAKKAFENIRKGIQEEKAQKAARRAKLRQNYRPLKITASSSPRQYVDLSGNWLFMPSQELSRIDSGSDPLTADSDWHVLGVPQFWKPIQWWIYSAGSGTSHNYLRKEIARCEQFTFDYKATNSGWYRQWIDVPESLRGKRFILKFDAVAGVSEVYWNGKRVGSNIGMFAPFSCEVTSQLSFGKPNLLAVYVSSGRTNQSDADKVKAVAVTVNVTEEMLNSLPHGWYKAGMAGIWQPVRLEITNQDRISDVVFRPNMTGAEIITDVDAKSSGKLEVRHSIVEKAAGKPLGGKMTESRSVSSSLYTVKHVLQGAEPKLWSPEHPNLYLLKTRLLSSGKVIDEVTTTVGFKEFTVKGNRLYLNGKPYFIRGANMPPHGLASNDRELADKFIKLMHDGNTMATRFHVAPPSQIWMDACDRYGVGASVGETWPWVLMGDTPIPDRKLLDIWKNDFLGVVKANRNHPSLLMWTISNESYFEGRRDPQEDRKLEKYQVFSDLIKAVRSIDPGRPVVLHSGYVRPVEDVALIEANGIDDGDIDDRHAYFGWYAKSPFHLDVANDIESFQKTTGRPLISQEASTGYPDNDTGHPTLTYIKNHIVPQSWVGDYALYSARPDMFLEVNAQITKDYAEKIRRDRKTISGWMLFANSCWFKDVYDADRINPYPVYWEVKKAWQPVLVSLVSSSRHFEVGQAFTSDVYVVNDDPDRPVLDNLTLIWRIYGKSDDPGTSGMVNIPSCRYDSKCKSSVEFTVPENLPADRSQMMLELTLVSNDEVVSRNDYPIVCAKKQWCRISDNRKLYVVESDNSASEYLSGLGYQCAAIRGPDWPAVEKGACVVVAPGITRSMLGSTDLVSKFLADGGRILLMSPELGENSILRAVPGIPADSLKSVQVSGDFVDILIPELLSGLDPMDMHWWNAPPGGLARVCSTSYQLPDSPGISKLARHIQPHSYLKRKEQDIERLTSWPVIEFRVGKGSVVISSMLFADDPVAKRFYRNLIGYMTGN